MVTSTWDVFLSHSSRDKAPVQTVRGALERAGITAWFDEEQISTGDSIPLKIEEGLEGSRIVAVFLSPSFLASDWTAAERAAFTYTDPANRKRKLIPILVEDCDVPRAIAHLRRVDYTLRSIAATDSVVAAIQQAL